MKPIIGNAATGEKFFKREKEIQKIWDRIERGNHVLLSAPRRVGKTSILYHLQENPKPNYKLIYILTEAVNNENEFFKRVYDHVFENLKTWAKYGKKFEHFSKILLSKVDAVNLEGIELGESKVSYREHFIDLISSLEFANEKLIIAIDEFPQTIENIKKDESESNAIKFLELNRELRQNRELSSKIQFIYCGSIGLENIVSSLNSSSTINDIVPVHIQSLSKVEANNFIDSLLTETDLEISLEVREYIFSQIKWLIPFYLQLVIDQICYYDFEDSSKSISEEVIDKVIESMLEDRTYFDHWFSRLRKAYQSNEFNFAKELLNKISESGSISSSEVTNFAHKYSLQSNYLDIVHALKHDGYINNSNDSKTYVFNFPLLKMWWNKNVAN